MKIIKYILIFSLPVLLFINLWRFVNMGDSFTFIGLKDTANYMSQFPGFESTYKAIVGATQESEPEWYDYVFTVVTGGAYSIGKALFGGLNVAVNATADTIKIIVWAFGWIFGAFGGK